MAQLVACWNTSGTCTPYNLPELSYEMAKTPGIMLSNPLHKQESPTIEDKDLVVTSYKERFDSANCTIALKRTGLYESSTAA